MKKLSDLRYFKLMNDVIKIAEYKLWDCKPGDRKADKIINKIHSGKYGSRAGLWVQVEDSKNDLHNWAIKKWKELELMINRSNISGILKHSTAEVEWMCHERVIRKWRGQQELLVEIFELSEEDLK